jgi:hypothetical protein
MFRGKILFPSSGLKMVSAFKSAQHHNPENQHGYQNISSNAAKNWQRLLTIPQH